MSLNKLDLVRSHPTELPNNIEAEQSVIGSILVSNDILDDVSPIINYTKFYDPIHQKIFLAIENLISKGMLANPITLKNYFENDKNLIELEGHEYLVKITKFSTSLRQAIEYAKIIKEREKVDIKPSNIDLLKEIKSAGIFNATVNLHSEIQANILIKVEKSEEKKS